MLPVQPWVLRIKRIAGPRKLQLALMDLAGRYAIYQEPYPTNPADGEFT